MPTLISILNQEDKKRFESPPLFSDEERAVFFEASEWSRNVLDSFPTLNNKVGFVLQLGYFRSANKFFSTKRFHQDDVRFAAGALGIQEREINLQEYSSTTYERHQPIILQHLGFRRFDQEVRILAEREALALSKKQMRPRSILMSLVDFLRSKKIEVPGYHALSVIIADALKRIQRDLDAQIELHLSDEHKKLLDGLLEVSEKYSDDRQDLKIKRYTITLLKKSNQSTRPAKIRQNVEDLDCLKELFIALQSAIGALGLDLDSIEFNARIAVKSQVFQLARRDTRKYLYLLAFVIDRYYRLNDLLGDLILQCVQTAVNTAFREHKDRYFQNRASHHQAMKDLLDEFGDQLAKLKEVAKVVNADDMNDTDKVNSIKSLIADQDGIEQIEERIRALEHTSSQALKNGDYYDLFETKSVRLQNRVSPIVKALEFDADTSEKSLISAIDYFKRKNGSVGFEAPLDFLEDDEREIVSDATGKIRVSLYKIMLFQHIADGIKSGALNLKHSYKFRPFEYYLISTEKWEREKDELIERAGLVGFEDFSKVAPALWSALSDQFHKTNMNIQSGNNKHVKIDKKGNLVVSTPQRDKVNSDRVASLFPKERVIPLFEVLSTVNKLTSFTDCLEHHQVKHVRKNPRPNILIAGVTGLGCNHGIRRIAKISRNVTQNELEYAVNWHFTVDNLMRCNDKVLELMERLQLPKLFKRSGAETHTSSDGQKYNIHVESLNANYSYKYFGKGKGVTVYVFIDESHRLFYSVVISSSESEAAYVIDGLMHNDVVQSDIHSTDTAGYSEIVFGVCHLLGIAFAPRIKSFMDQKLYSFEKRSKMKSLNYPILPNEQINSAIIHENWDEILRFIVTIKLRETPASQLFRRLSSYSRQHPLYKALKEFGKIIKSLFLLRYIDEVELRQAIEKQLNKQESSNKFGNAVFHGNNHEFQQVTKEEQMIAEGCKRLIENSVICWNYLYLSQLLCDTQSEEERKAILEIIKNGSVVIWQHVNLQGEYDFSDDYLEDAIDFHIEEVLKLQVA